MCAQLGNGVERSNIYLIWGNNLEFSYKHEENHDKSHGLTAGH